MPYLHFFLCFWSSGASIPTHKPMCLVELRRWPADLGSLGSISVKCARLIHQRLTPQLQQDSFLRHSAEYGFSSFPLDII